MSESATIDVDDIGEAVRQNRPLHKALNYRYSLAGRDLEFRTATVADPVPLGRQILAGGGLGARAGYKLFAVLPSGDFEDVRLDEPFDLRGRGAERFVTFQTDRVFSLTLKGAEVSWGEAGIGGVALYRLAEPDAGEAVFLEVPGGQDRLIEADDLIRLDGPRIERFIVAPRPKPTFEITVNSRPRVINDSHVTFEQVVQIAFPGAHEANVEFSMTYRNVASHPHAGNLAAGGSVTVKKEGAVFNVTRTVQS